MSSEIKGLQEPVTTLSPPCAEPAERLAVELPDESPGIEGRELASETSPKSSAYSARRKRKGTRVGGFVLGGPSTGGGLGVALEAEVDRHIRTTVDAIEHALGPRKSPQRMLIVANIAEYLRDFARLLCFERTSGITSWRKRDVLPVTKAKWDLMGKIERALAMIGLDADELPAGVTPAYWQEVAARQGR